MWHKSQKQTHQQIIENGASPQELAEWIEHASKKQLLGIIKTCEQHTPAYRLAEKVLLIRVAEPHWIAILSFVLGAICTAIAMQPVVKQWLPPRSVVQKADDAQAPKLNSESEIPPQGTTLRPSSDNTEQPASVLAPKLNTNSQKMPTNTPTETSTNSTHS
jgi:hypothetical protein